MVTTILVSLSLLLSGCAGQVNILPTLDKNIPVTSDNGVLVARIINASAYPLPFNQLTIAAENLNESKELKPERMLSLTPRIDGSTVYSSTLKPGTYALSSIRSFHSRGDYWYSRFISSDAKFGTFEVKAGQVTDLGTLIYYQKPQEDRYLDTLLRLPENEKGEVLKKYFSFYQYDQNNILSWNDDDKEEERESLYLSVAQNPTVFNHRYLAPDNSIYFLGKLGVILKRTSAGEWEVDAVDTNFELNDIAQNNQGDLIVGGVEGKLFWKPFGGEWHDISLTHNVQIERLVFHNETTIDMITRNGIDLNIFRTMILPHIEWQEMNHYTSVSGWKNNDFIANPFEEKSKRKKSSSKKMKPKADRFISSVSLSDLNKTSYISVRTISKNDNPVFSSGEVEAFGYHPETWTIYSPEKDPEVTSIISAGAAKLGITEAGFWSMSGQSTYSRYDKKAGDWKKINTSLRTCPDGSPTTKKNCDSGLALKKSIPSISKSFNLISVPMFKNELEAVAIVNFSDIAFWSGERSSETKILSTSNGGKSWIDTGYTTPNKYCTSLVQELSDRLLVSCNGSSGDFYESFDDGANWQHVRQQENF